MIKKFTLTIEVPNNSDKKELNNLIGELIDHALKYSKKEWDYGCVFLVENKGD